jgi:hypothetical protein
VYAKRLCVGYYSLSLSTHTHTTKGKRADEIAGERFTQLLNSENLKSIERDNGKELSENLSDLEQV